MSPTRKVSLFRSLSYLDETKFMKRAKSNCVGFRSGRRWILNQGTSSRCLGKSRFPCRNAVRRIDIFKFAASMWTSEQSREIETIARTIIPDIKFHAIPYGLQVAEGPEAIVGYLTDRVPTLLES